LSKFTFIDLFAGIGGFRVALQKNGGSCVFSSEWDKYAQITYYNNFNEVPAGDITKISEDIIPEHDILTAGFPCQPFSISGSRKGFEDTRGTLFFDVARIVNYHKPKVVFLENVKNFEKHDNGKTLNVVLKTMENMGYKTFYKILNAGDFGLPTKRERIYIVCFRLDINSSMFEFPKPHTKKVYLESFIDFENEENAKKIDLKHVTFSKKDDKYESKPIQIAKINKGGQGERIYSIKGHAITFSANGGGFFSKTGGYFVNEVARKLTPKECSRVMGFGRDFKINTIESQAYKQFGNSVAVNVISDIMKSILKILEG
jgi:DNA (cytosine-5)-methyltransferase 1